jgi:hypothetical protein
MTNTYAEQQQRARDLRTQLAEVGASERNDQEMLFQEWSPGRTLVTLWSMEDGTEITIPQYMVASAIQKRMADGRFRFTAYKDQAPEFKAGTVRCFLAEDSPERTSGLLEEAGLDHLPVCAAKNLRSGFSKRRHGQNRHSDSWNALQEHIGDKRREVEQTDRRNEMAAIRDLAGARTTTKKE